MAEINQCNPAPGTFKEAVCIDADRIYDSCCDRDCLEDLRCFFTPSGQEIVDKALSVRVRTAEVINVFVDVEPVYFNRGYYSCDLTFFFLVKFDVFIAPHSQPVPICGICFFDKKVILYGSEGNVKVFSNEFTLEDANDNQSKPTTNMPKCSVSCVDPVPLSAHICRIRDCYQRNISCIPSCVCKCVGGELCTDRCDDDRTIYVTLGLFSIVQLIRNVQILIPVYDFCIPEKQCTDTSDSACDVFKKIKFPTDDFFPRSDNDDCGCGCGSMD